MYLFVYRDFYVGGCEYLIEKIGSAMVLAGQRAEILCKTMDPMMRERYRNKKIEIHMLSDWSKLAEKIEQFDCQEPINILTFLWRSFYPCYTADRRNKRTIYYAVNWEAFTKDLLGVKPLVGKSREYCAGIVEKFIKRGNFIAMDDMTIQCTQEFYGHALKISKEDCKIIYISVDMSEVEPITREQIAENFKQPHVLTISRADFSMKGYLIGLLEWYASTKMKDVCLDIVTYGPDEEAVKEMVNQLPPDKKKKVVLYGKTDYDQLDKIIKGSIVYVGMGTTLLDAAERGIISVPVEAFTNKLNTSGLFTEQYDLLGVFAAGRDFDELVRHILVMSVDEYMVNSQVGIEIVKEHYELKRNTARIQEYFNLISDDDTEKGDQDA